jgi:hypothetical protein
MGRGGRRKGAGRPTDPRAKRAKVSFRCTETQRQWWEEAADRVELTPAEAWADALDDWAARVLAGEST